MASTKLEVTGLGSYRSAMNAAAKSVKNLGTELDLLEAKYKQSGDKGTYMAGKAAALQKQIQAQQKAVSAASDGLEAAKQQYGDGSEQVEQWQASLNRARTRLTQLETALQRNAQTMQQTNDATAEAAENLAAVGDSGSQASGGVGELATSMRALSKMEALNNLKSGIDGITGGIDGAVSKIKEISEAIWNAGIEAAQWASETIDKAESAGLDVETYQRFDRGLKAVGTDMDKLAGIQNKFIGNAAQTHDATDNWSKGLTALGISAKDIQSADVPGLFWEITEGLAKMDKATRDQVGAQIFGEDWKELSKLTDQWQEFQEASEGATVVGEEDVQNLDEFNKSTQELSASWETLKNQTLAGIAPALTTIAEGLRQIIDQFTKWEQSEEGQKVMTNLSNAISTLFTTMTQDMDFGSILSGATGVLEGINGALEWISTNGGEVAGALKNIAFAYGFLKLSSLGVNIANTIMGLSNLFPGLKGFLGGGVPTGTPTATPTGSGTPVPASAPVPASGTPSTGTPSAAPAPSSGGGGGASAAGAAGGAPLVAKAAPKTTLLTKFGMVAEGLALDAAFIGLGVTLAAQTVKVEKMIAEGKKQAEKREKEVKEAKDKIDEFQGEDGPLQGMVEGWELLSELTVKGDRKGLEGQHSYRLFNTLQALAAWEQGENGELTGKSAYDRWKEGTLNPKEGEDAERIAAESEAALQSTYERLGIPEEYRMSAAELDSMLTQMSEATFDMNDENNLFNQFEAIIRGIQEGNWGSDTVTLTDQIEATDLVNQILDAMTQKLLEGSEDSTSAGEQVGQGFANGMWNMVATVQEAAKGLADAAKGGLEGALDIHSPSRVTEKLGAYVDAGFARGIDRNIAAVEDATTRVGMAVTRPLAGAGTGMMRAGDNYSSALYVGNYYQRSDADMYALAGQLADLNRRGRAGLGAR